MARVFEFEFDAHKLALRHFPMRRLRGSCLFRSRSQHDLLTGLNIQNSKCDV